MTVRNFDLVARFKANLTSILQRSFNCWNSFIQKFIHPFFWSSSICPYILTDWRSYPVSILCLPLVLVEDIHLLFSASTTLNQINLKTLLNCFLVSWLLILPSRLLYKENRTQSTQILSPPQIKSHILTVVVLLTTTFLSKMSNRRKRTRAFPATERPRKSKRNLLNQECWDFCLLIKGVKFECESPNFSQNIVSLTLKVVPQLSV
jgi:hypothetical protein